MAQKSRCGIGVPPISSSSPTRSHPPARRAARLALREAGELDVPIDEFDVRPVGLDETGRPLLPGETLDFPNDVAGVVGVHIGRCGDVVAEADAPRRG